MLEYIANEIIEGRRLTKEDKLDFLLSSNLDILLEQANKIREALCGNQMDLCAIINGKSGCCSEDCKFCAQSANSKTEIREYPFLEEEVIVDTGLEYQRNGIQHFSIVTAGRALLGEDLEKALHSYHHLHKESKLSLCACHGLLKEKELNALKENGVTRYHINIETSRSYFSNICTTHTYDEKIEIIKLAKKAKLSVCSGGIIGMGETFKDRIDMALELAELDVDSIPINVFTPITGTPFEKIEPMSEEDILRTIAIFRFILPDKEIRIAAGRRFLKENGKQAFLSGANATITGNMLTTVGSNIKEDINMFKQMGYCI